MHIWPTWIAFSTGGLGYSAHPEGKVIYTGPLSIVSSSLVAYAAQPEGKVMHWAAVDCPQNGQFWLYTPKIKLN